jgi:hypothetical protein
MRPKQGASQRVFVVTKFSRFRIGQQPKLRERDVGYDLVFWAGGYVWCLEKNQEG